MNTSITIRNLTEREIDQIFEEIKLFPNPLFEHRKKWHNFDRVYIMEYKNSLVGICGMTVLNDWTKLGPFIILRQYQKQGFGKLLIKQILIDNKNKKLYIGSRNPAVHRIATGNGFKQTAIHKLPKEIKKYLFKSLSGYLNFNTLLEIIKKNPSKEGPYVSFIFQ